MDLLAVVAAGLLKCAGRLAIPIRLRIELRLLGLGQVMGMRRSLEVLQEKAAKLRMDPFRSQLAVAAPSGLDAATNKMDQGFGATLGLPVGQQALVDTAWVVQYFEVRISLATTCHHQIRRLEVTCLRPLGAEILAKERVLAFGTFLHWLAIHLNLNLGHHSVPAPRPARNQSLAPHPVQPGLGLAVCHDLHGFVFLISFGIELIRWALYFERQPPQTMNLALARMMLASGP